MNGNTIMTFAEEEQARLAAVRELVHAYLVFHEDFGGLGESSTIRELRRVWPEAVEE